MIQKSKNRKVSIGNMWKVIPPNKWRAIAATCISIHGDKHFLIIRIMF